MPKLKTNTQQVIEREIQKRRNKARAQFLLRFFKTGKGQYGHGDVFLGLSVPEQRVIASQYGKVASLKDIAGLLKSSIHEYRFTALLILVSQFEQAETKERKKLFDFYLKHKERVNNWDLVDASASQIVGRYLLDNSRKALYTLARSKSLWDRRIAIVATHAFIKEDDFTDTLALTELLIRDTEDLIHKASGWMLREVGKRDERVLLSFLNVFAGSLPRTTLRYSLERLTPAQKRMYMSMRSS